MSSHSRHAPEDSDLEPAVVKSIPATPQARPNCKLPQELWLRIFLLLEDDLATLRSCILICKELRGVAEEVCCRFLLTTIKDGTVFASFVKTDIARHVRHLVVDAPLNDAELHDETVLQRARALFEGEAPLCCLRLPSGLLSLLYGTGSSAVPRPAIIANVVTEPGPDSYDQSSRSQPPLYTLQIGYEPSTSHPAKLKTACDALTHYCRTVQKTLKDLRLLDVPMDAEKLSTAVLGKDLVYLTISLGDNTGTGRMMHWWPTEILCFDHELSQLLYLQLDERKRRYEDEMNPSQSAKLDNWRKACPRLKDFVWFATINHIRMGRTDAVSGREPWYYSFLPEFERALFSELPTMQYFERPFFESIVEPVERCCPFRFPQCYRPRKAVMPDEKSMLSHP